VLLHVSISPCLLGVLTHRKITPSCKCHGKLSNRVYKYPSLMLYEITSSYTCNRTFHFNLSSAASWMPSWRLERNYKHRVSVVLIRYICLLFLMTQFIHVLPSRLLVHFYRGFLPFVRTCWDPFSSRLRSFASPSTEASFLQ
jgi:hypothetical protein